jgi:hypothetical protein
MTPTGSSSLTRQRPTCSASPPPGQPVRRHAGKPVTVRPGRRHGTLRAALNGAVRAELISVNPGRYPELPRAARPRPQVWTPALTGRWQLEGLDSRWAMTMAPASFASWTVKPPTPPPAPLTSSHGGGIDATAARRGKE